jgi:hypothetical protein
VGNTNGEVVMNANPERAATSSRVLPGGDDWTIKRADGVMELDRRVTLETDDGALVHMTFEGIRDVDLLAQRLKKEVV